ncbi:MAG: nucleotidyl transferase AbiEii/AbiGii toxin family protein [Bdellovibrionales bacterium]|nr:nucleotidyl transferase AbiEii/AbiGii toxin family protein [Bdellovibrionales bacterium]
MQILETLDEHAKKKKVPYLLIGGHAMNLLGFPRQTSDLDLLVKKSEASYWEEMILALGYECFQKHHVFCRYSAKGLDNWPIDLMLVDDEVFESLLAESIERELSGCSVHIPSAQHMIALKLHALKQHHPHREAKDTLDIAELLRLHEISNEEFQRMCEKYGRIDLYDKFKR